MVVEGCVVDAVIKSSLRRVNVLVKEKGGDMSNRGENKDGGSML